MSQNASGTESVKLTGMIAVFWIVGTTLLYVFVVNLVKYYAAS